MGGGSWSTDFYAEREAVRRSTGASAFKHSDDIVKGRAARAVHASLNPHKIKIRESRDSKEHPESNPVAVIFDVTGSMAGIPVTMQQKLPHLMDILNKEKYLPDPQVLVGAVGDFFVDHGPFQVGQFESDNRVEDHLGNTWLEGGGGGSAQESYQLALYFFARHTSLDCFEKRKTRGYLFLMGDEMTYDVLTKREAQEVFGDAIQEDIPVEDLVKEVREKYNLFFILPGGASHSGEARIRDQWVRLLGSQSVIMLDDPASVCETITMTIGLNEGRVNLDSAKEHLKAAGAKTGAINGAAAALSDLAKEKGAASKVARL